MNRSNYFWLFINNLFIHLFRKNFSKSEDFTDSELTNFINIRKDNGLIIEAGAYNCFHTLKLNELFHNSNIISIEADPTNFQLGLKEIQKFSNVTLLNFVLSPVKAARMKFYVDDFNGESGSILKPTKHKLFFNNFHQINNKYEFIDCITLDDLVSQYQISQIDLLWLDVQGIELEILRNFKKITFISFLHVEFSFLRFYRRANTFLELDKFLISQGFERIATAHAILSGNAIYKNLNL